VTRVTQILCAAEPRGSGDAVERLLEAARDQTVDAVAVLGDLSDGSGGTDGYRTVFRLLSGSGLPTYWIPGPGDAPVVVYLREAHNIEVVFAQLHGVHGTAAFTPDRHVLIAGLGGEIADDPAEEREEQQRLRYPRWELEYRLKLVQELPGHELVLMTSTPPAHKGERTAGSEAVAELVATHRPRLVLTGGERRTGMLGRSMLLAPGSLQDGQYAIANLRSHEVQLEQLPALRA
jgi:uncharacterized protein